MMLLELDMGTKAMLGTPGIRTAEVTMAYRIRIMVNILPFPFFSEGVPSSVEKVQWLDDEENHRLKVKVN